ncbi:hypothetical protein BDF19DRAFT_431330 [Syncephalis fuscata]|nr:hypothetical protein BDF19DRAFT_431330 [Syncephalis fuscata]
MHFSIAKLALLTVSACVALAAHANAKCSTPLVRREIRDLSENERNIFLQAMRKIMTDGQPSTLGQMVQYHLHTPIFLPWHRKYLKELENALRRVDTRVILPYWDWSADAWAPHASPILSEKYFGGNGVGPSACIQDGPFKNIKPFGLDPTWPQCLFRQYNLGQQLSRFNTPEEIANIIHSSHTYTEFAQRLEGIPHAIIHNNIGGLLKFMGAPNDPLFFMHHGNIDRYWAEWQKQKPEQAKSIGPWDVNTTLRPWYVPASSVFDTQSDQLCYVYATPIKAYENRNAQAPPSVQRVRRSASSGCSNSAAKSANATAPSSEYIDLVHPSPLAPVSEDWCKMNGINITMVRKFEEEGRKFTKKLYSIDGYISPAALWNRNDLLRTLIETNKDIKFTVDINGKRVELSIPLKTTITNSIAELKQSAIAAGMKILGDEDMLKSLNELIGNDGIAFLSNLFSDKSAFGKLLKNAKEELLNFASSILNNSILSK